MYQINVDIKVLKETLSQILSNITEFYKIDLTLLLLFFNIITNQLSAAY